MISLYKSPKHIWEYLEMSFYDACTKTEISIYRCKRCGLETRAVRVEDQEPQVVDKLIDCDDYLFKSINEM